MNIPIPRPQSQVPIPQSQVPLPQSQVPIPRSQVPIPQSQVPIPRAKLNIATRPTLNLTTAPVLSGAPRLVIAESVPVPVPKSKIRHRSPTARLGAKYGSYQSVMETDLPVNFPNLSQEPIRPQRVMPSSPGTEISFPTFNTSINSVPVDTRGPRPPPSLTAESDRGPLPGTRAYQMKVLSEIDPNRLIETRTGKGQDYKLEVIKEFARRLGITVSSKRKAELVQDIRNLRREMGLD